MNTNNLDSTNKYVQGSVWRWSNNFGQKMGVQSSERPVLIISNNTFNTFSPSVNCVSITSVLKDSPVHVPLYINTDSHIQCEQIHTIPKNELVEFKGIVPNSTLSQVKAKLRIQFDMSSDRNTEMFNSIKKTMDELNNKVGEDALYSLKESIDELNEKAENGFGLPKLEEEIVNLLANVNESYQDIIKEIRKVKKERIFISKNSKADIVENQIVVPLTKIEQVDKIDNQEPQTPIKMGKGNKRQYTEEDKKFIIDKSNSVEDLMGKYGYDKVTAYKMRAYFKKRLSAESDIDFDNSASKEGDIKSENISRKSIHRQYTEEDKLFIIDENNSIDMLMEKFGFKNKQAAYNARAYIRKTFEKTNI